MASIKTNLCARNSVVTIWLNERCARRHTKTYSRTHTHTHKQTPTHPIFNYTPYKIRFTKPPPETASPAQPYKCLYTQLHRRRNRPRRRRRRRHRTATSKCSIHLHACNPQWRTRFKKVHTHSCQYRAGTERAINRRPARVRARIHRAMRGQQKSSSPTTSACHARRSLPFPPHAVSKWRVNASINHLVVCVIKVNLTTLCARRRHTHAVAVAVAVTDAAADAVAASASHQPPSFVARRVAELLHCSCLPANTLRTRRRRRRLIRHVYT